MTIIEVRNSDGLVARCDAKCHDAQEPACDCVCHGRYHGKKTGSRELVEQLRADGAAFVARLASEARGRLGPEVAHALNLDLPGFGP